MNQISAEALRTKFFKILPFRRVIFLAQTLRIECETDFPTSFHNSKSQPSKNVRFFFRLAPIFNSFFFGNESTVKKVTKDFEENK